MASPGLSLSAEEKRLFRILARQVAVLLSSVDLQRRATTDSLTTLANRAQTEQILRHELMQAAAPLSVLLIDLDDFKRINDTHGHPAGDQVLRDVSMRLRCTLRMTDSAGRWGGEELLAILPGTDELGAALVAEKLLHELRATPMGSPGLSVTASVGVACYPGDVPVNAQGASTLLRNADQALYMAKESGKDQLAVFDPARSARSLERTQRLQLQRRRRRAPLAWLVCDRSDPAPLRVGYTSIGRDPASDVCLPSDGVSQRHGVIRVTPRGEVTYQDCSVEGTIHNGAPLEGHVRLTRGDVLTIGPFEFRFTDEPVSAGLRA
jgi:diguanylate cyclase (GGDEF)-like protein